MNAGTVEIGGHDHCRTRGSIVDQQAARGAPVALRVITHDDTIGRAPRLSSSIKHVHAPMLRPRYGESVTTSPASAPHSTRPWPQLRATFGVAALAAALVLSGCATTTAAPTPAVETAALPDVTGDPADEAQTQLVGLGFSVTLDAGEQSVWAPGNWVVERQDPAAGNVTPGASVTLHLGRPAPPPETVWEGITDGTWAGGDYALGQTVHPKIAPLTGNLWWDFDFTVTGPPVLTTKDGGETVTMTSTLAVTRVQDAWPDETFNDSVPLYFEAGVRPESERMNESWGVHTARECEQDILALGDSTTCTVAFTTTPDAIQDSYWQADVIFVAAWPSQQPGPRP